MANITHEDNANPKPNPALPEEMIYEILSRLPAKSLSEFQFVCKSWKSLISSPEFIKTHLSKSTNDPGFAHHRLLYIKWIWRPDVKHGDRRTEYMESWSCSLYSLLNDDTVTETKSYRPGDNEYIFVVGYCNGLFCLTSGEQIFLWNPFTGKSGRLPKHEHDEHRAHGFCYDESNDDYKVFALSISGPGDEYKNNVSVYSSKSGCWRMIGDYYFGRIYGWGIFANGALHSLVGRKNMQSNNAEPNIIVSIDMKTETYREVPLPPKGEDGRSRTTLDTFGESLSVLCSFKTRADFWVMKECGVEESWTKLFTIPLPCDSDWIKPLCISIGGDIMLSSGSAILLYNPKSNTFKKLLDIEFGAMYTYTYVESLVSPPN